LGKAAIQKKGHPGMAHKIDIGRIGQMPIGVHIAPPDFELFYEHGLVFKIIIVKAKVNPTRFIQT